jgi:hypothetical protein
MTPPVDSVFTDGTGVAGVVVGVVVGVGTVVVVVGPPGVVGGGTGLWVVLVLHPPAVVHPGSV